MFRSVLRGIAACGVALAALAIFVGRGASAAVMAPSAAVGRELASAPGQEIAIFSGGCFWGVQAVFQHLKGVTSAVSGYAGGHVESPHYEMVSTGLTGHAESVSVTFDPSQVSYGTILMVYFSVA